MKKIVYHGRRGGLNLKEDRPVFFADKKEDSEWYAYERGPSSEKPMITEATVDVGQLASLDDLKKAVKEVGATRKDIQKHSVYDGWNDIDYLYVPEVRKILKDKGFDGFQGWDVLTNMEILITVIFDTERITILNQEVVQERL
jgi:hypothetical protein